MKLAKMKFGVVLDGSNDTAENLNLATIALAKRHGFRPGRLPSRKAEDFGQIVSEMANDAVDYLNGKNPIPYTVYEYEGNCLMFSPLLETAREEVEFISTKEEEEPEPGFRGHWLHVNDHGNVTLYERKAGGRDLERWSVV